MKVILQAPCGNRRDTLAPLSVLAEAYAKSVGAEYVMAKDLAPRTLPAAWNQMYAIAGELARREDGDLVYWLGPTLTPPERDVFAQELEAGGIACSTIDAPDKTRRAYPRAILISVGPKSRKVFRRAVYYARADRTPASVFPWCVGDGIEILAEELPQREEELRAIAEAKGRIAEREAAKLVAPLEPQFTTTTPEPKNRPIERPVARVRRYGPRQQ